MTVKQVCHYQIPLTSPFYHPVSSLPAQTRNTLVPVLWASDLMVNNDQAARNLVVLSHVGFIKDAQTSSKRKVTLKFLSHD